MGWLGAPPHFHSGGSVSCLALPVGRLPSGNLEEEARSSSGSPTPTLQVLGFPAALTDPGPESRQPCPSCLGSGDLAGP